MHNLHLHHIPFSNQLVFMCLKKLCPCFITFLIKLNLRTETDVEAGFNAGSNAGANAIASAYEDCRLCIDSRSWEGESCLKTGHFKGLIIMV